MSWGWTIIASTFLLTQTAWAMPCQNPATRYEHLRAPVFDNPTKAMSDARLMLQSAARIDEHTQIVCGLQLSLGAFLSDSDIKEDKAQIQLAMQFAKSSPMLPEYALLEALYLNMNADHTTDSVERLQALDRVTKSMPTPVRALMLYLTIELFQDPKVKASLEAEIDTLLSPGPSIGDFERVLLLELQAFHVDRNRNPGKKIELRENFLPLLRKLKLAYWEAFIVYNHARTYEYLETPSAIEAAGRYYAEAEELFQNLEKDNLYASILLGKASLWHRKGRKAEAIRLVQQAATFFEKSENRIWQGEVWKRLAIFYLEDKRFQDALDACSKALTLFGAEHETDRNQIDELSARAEYGLGHYEKAMDLMEKHVEDFKRIENKQRQRYVAEQGARYGLTLEEERNKIRQLNQETAKKQAALDSEGRKARERGMLVRLFAAVISMIGGVWVFWILRRGLVLGKTIRSLNSHMENHVLERFLPPTLVHEVAAGRLHLDERPNTRLVTILAADIVSFTNGTESLGSERIAVILNRFMVSMADVIFEYKGTIDKFIGDGVIAIFGAPVDMDAETQALQASRCAQAMIKALDSLNQELLAGHSWKLRLRIGMHQGVALVGSFGTRQRSDYGAIGDAVHIAARIQAVAGPNEILLTTSVKHHLDSTLCSRRGDLKIREQSQAISMHSLSLTAELKAA